MIYHIKDDVSGRVKRFAAWWSAPNDKEISNPMGTAIDWRLPITPTPEQIADMQSRVLRMEGPLERLLDFQSAFSGSNGYALVSSRVKIIIEELEPELHSFWDVGVWSLKDKAFLDEPYFVCQVTQTVSCVDAELSRNSEFDIGGRTFRRLNGLLPSRKVLRPPEPGTVHLWRDPVFTIDHFCSEELYKRFKAARVKGAAFKETVSD